MRRKEIKEGQRYVSVSIPTKLIRGVDALVDEGSGGYETRAEFVKDAIRHRLREQEDRPTTDRLTPVENRPDHTVLTDHTLGRAIYIERQNDTLICNLCESTDCIHTRYAQTLPGAQR